MDEFATLFARAASWLDIGFAVFHLAFWKLFRWREAAAAVGRVNAGILQVLNIQLVLLFAGFGAIAVLHAENGLKTSLGRDVMLLWAAFWALRAALQPLFFGMEHWSSKILVAFFATGCLLHLLPALVGRW